MSAEFVNPFTPNTVIRLADITEMPAFEDMVAQAVDPDMTTLQRQRWDSRPPIRDLIRPIAHNGSIVDIELTPLEDPYEKLQSARQDGWVLKPGNTPGSTKELNAQYRAERCLGFHFVANARSSGRGVIGEIQVGLWYLPVVRYERAHTVKPSKQTGLGGGLSVKRVVTQPRLETENFIRSHDESVRVALSALADAARRTARRERER